MLHTIQGGLKEFLLSESFEGILLDYNRFDVMWRNIHQRVIKESPVTILVPEYTGFVDESMQRFLNAIYLSKDRKLLPFLDQLLLELSKENDLRPIHDEIKARLKQIKFHDKRIKRMAIFNQNINNEHSQRPKIRGSAKRQQLTETELFPRKQFNADDKLCFILMPFDQKYNSVYDIIKHATEEMGLEAKRADNIFNVKPIVHDVWEYINKARFLIANLSGKNPNVFYEVGLSHALNKKVILVTHSMKDVPFDLKHLRCIVYKDRMDGVGEFKAALMQTMRELLNE